MRRRKRSRGGQKKAHSQRIHAKKRALERCGVNLNRHDMRELVTSIQKGHFSLLEKQSNRVSVFKAKIDEEYYPVVYDRQRKTIVTVLPKDAYDDSRRPSK